MADEASGSARSRLTHIGVCVSDLERSERFYVDGLGFTEQARRHFDDAATAQILGLDGVDVHLVYLERDGVRIELLGYRAPAVVGGGAVRSMAQAGLTHLSFLVDDYDSVCAAIVRTGGAVLADTEVRFDHGNRGVMATDPDGTRIELIESRSP